MGRLFVGFLHYFAHDFKLVTRLLFLLFTDSLSEDRVMLHLGSVFPQQINLPLI